MVRWCTVAKVDSIELVARRCSVRPEVVEGEQRLAVLPQFLGGLGILYAIGERKYSNA